MIPVMGGQFAIPSVINLTGLLYSKVRVLFSFINERQVFPYEEYSYEEYRDLLETVCRAQIEGDSAESIAEFLDDPRYFKEVATLVKMGANLKDFKKASQCKASFEMGLSMKELIDRLPDSLNAKLLEDALLPYCQGEDEKAFLKGYKKLDSVRSVAAQEEEEEYEYVMQLCSINLEAKGIKVPWLIYPQSHI